MKYCTSIVIAVGLMLVAVVGASAQDWVKIAPAGQGFEVMMPGTVEPSIETKAGPEGPVTTTLYILRAPTGVFLVGYADYDPKFNFDIRAEINANRDNFMKSFKDGKILGEKERSVGGGPGIEFTADLNATTFMTSRVFVIGRRPYQLAFISAKGSDQADAAKFFDSFKVVKK